MDVVLRCFLSIHLFFECFHTLHQLHYRNAYQVWQGSVIQIG